MRTNKRMKKIIVVLMLVLPSMGTWAQMGSDFGVNMFMSIQGGTAYYHNGNEYRWPGYSGGISVGKWILNPLAARVGLDFQELPSLQDERVTSTFASATAEFMWDFNATFSRVRNWRVNIYPMIGLGVFYRSAFSVGTRSYGTDHAFHGMLGAHVPWRVADGWDLFIEYKGYFLPEQFDGRGSAVNMHSFTAGVTRRFTESPFGRRTAHESRSVSEDWFVGAGVGPNYSAFSLFRNKNMGGLSMLGLGAEVMFGKNFSNFWTIRFEATGLTAHQKYDTVREQPGPGYSFTAVHADVLVNLSHALSFSRGVKTNFMPYLGSGVIWRYDKPVFDFSADIGLMIRRYVSQEGDVFVDMKYIMMPGRVAGGGGGSIYGYGIPSVTVGYIHNFGRSTTRYRVPYKCVD